MKKIFTLLFAVGMFTLAQAQPGNRGNRNNRDNRDNRQIDQRDDDRYDDDEKNIAINNHPYDRHPYDRDYRNDRDDRYGNSRFSNERRMKMQIAQINREFDYKIQRLRNNFYMSRWEKQREFRFLEDQRQREIRRVYVKFKYKNRYNDRDYPNNRHY